MSFLRHKITTAPLFFLLILIFLNQGCQQQTSLSNQVKSPATKVQSEFPKNSTSASATEIQEAKILAKNLEKPVAYYDVIVYGGTPAGLIAAIAAAREGAKVAIIEPSGHLGGMVTGGLSNSDIGNQAVIGGIANEFFQKIGNAYGSEISYNFEPHVAEEVFIEMINQAGVDVYLNHSLKENGGVEKSGLAILKIITTNADIFTAKVFLDCSYEGDLMAQAGVSYTYGREAQTKYHETFAGVRPSISLHNFNFPVNAYTGDGALLPEISSTTIAGLGQGDLKITAYNYPLCLTNDPANSIPLVAPKNYNPARYQLLANWLTTLKKSENNRNLSISDVLWFSNLPNNKVDANNSGPFSTDYIGGNWSFIQADYQTREQIKIEHQEYIQGLLYFLGHDQQLATELISAFSKWGLAKDEFADNGNWPYQLYIREGRRMLGDFIMTQDDLQEHTEKFDSIGMGSYPIDSHHTQRFVTNDGIVKNEGDLQVFILPYQMPFRIMLPRKSEVTNLIVPVCVSASHVAYSSIRMEPQYMILGQAAGIAAKIAIDEKCIVQDINTEQLRIRLQKKDAVLALAN